LAAVGEPSLRDVLGEHPITENGIGVLCEGYRGARRASVEQSCEVDTSSVRDVGSHAGIRDVDHPSDTPPRSLLFHFLKEDSYSVKR
jgi:hypothetical protein